MAPLAISDSLTAMTRVLLVTNDFPPRRGGIQSYLHELVGQLLQSDNDYALTVYAPKWKGCEEFDEEARATGYEVVRHPTTLMLPGPGVDDRMRRLIADNDVETVWFGAAAPLALLASRARSAGVRRVVASTHGHEVGWSMLPLARNALRRIGDDTDVVTYVSALHPRPVRIGVRPARRAGVCAAGGGHRPVLAGSGGPRGDAVAVRARRPPGGRLPVPAGSPQGPGHADPRAARDPRARRRRGTGHRRRWTVSGDAAPARARNRGHRARGLHRRCAGRRTARPPRDGRRLRDAVPDAWRRARRRGPRHRLPRGVFDGSAGRRGRLRRCTGDGSGRGHRTRREGSATSTKSPRRSATYSPTRCERPRWAPPGVAGPWTTGSGALRPRDCTAS